MDRVYDVIVVGSGHAGAEAAWAAANLLPCEANGQPRVALVTIDPAKTGVMSCNPAIGGLAKGQIAREIDALGGLMGLATDIAGTQFRMLNTSKGPAVHGPRAQCDKHVYAEAVQHLVHNRPEIQVIAGPAERVIVQGDRAAGVVVGPMRPGSKAALLEKMHVGLMPFANAPVIEGEPIEIRSKAVVITTGTFMRGLMHTGETKEEGGRHGEAAAVGISGALRELGFELGRLKTGTPARLDVRSIDWDSLEAQHGDDELVPFSELTSEGCGVPGFEGFVAGRHSGCAAYDESGGGRGGWPYLPQLECRQTQTSEAAREAILANIDRAPMFNGQIETSGPRYCPSIEDKVFRFKDRHTHGVFLERESHRDNVVYCNGIASSLPADVQDVIVRTMPGCKNARIIKHGYAVEYDTILPHQIDATTMSKRVQGLFFAGQINGTSGYEEAGAQGLVAGLNAARHATGQDGVTLGRDEAYIGVLLDDLVTKTPVEPYRMFTSRAEFRLLLRADNVTDRLTGKAQSLGLLDSTQLGQLRIEHACARTDQLNRVRSAMQQARHGDKTLAQLCRQPEFSIARLTDALRSISPALASDRAAVLTAHSDFRYEAYVQRAHAEVKRHRELENRKLPADVDYTTLGNMRREAIEALSRFRPATFGQAARLEGITPADVTLLSVLIEQRKRHATV